MITFLKMKAFRVIQVSLFFNFLVRYGYIKRGKSKGWLHGLKLKIEDILIKRKYIE